MQERIQKIVTKSQWRRKIVEPRGAETKRRAVLPCFNLANIEELIATNSPDDSVTVLGALRVTSIK